MNKKRIISVVIPTYNNKANLSKIIVSLLRQKSLKKKDMNIIIHIDGCTDGTDSMIKEFKNNKINTIISKKRVGFTAGFKKLTKNLDSEFILLLNDDILIKDKHLISNFIKVFSINKKVSMIGGNPQPFDCNSFIERAILSSHNAFNKIRYEISNGNGRYTCDGKIIAFRRPFIQSLRYPKDLRETGNLDSFLYFHALVNGFKYLHRRNAVVYFRFPNNIKDYLNWTSRNNANRFLLKKIYGKKIIVKEYRLPIKIYVYKLIEFLKNPIGSLFIFIMSFYVTYRAERWNTWLEAKWPAVMSTKKMLSR